MSVVELCMKIVVLNNVITRNNTMCYCASNVYLGSVSGLCSAAKDM